MANFTHGKWVINELGDVTDEQKGNYIAMISLRNGNEEEHEANARAIKAVPEMYKVLQELVPILKDDGRLGIAYSIEKLLARIDGTEAQS